MSKRRVRLCSVDKYNLSGIALPDLVPYLQSLAGDRTNVKLDWDNDYDNNIEFYLTRLETDEEYAERLKKEAEEEAAARLKAERAAELAEARARSQYERLKLKYGKGD